MTINIAAISIFVVGVLLLVVTSSLAHDSENKKPNYFKPAATTAIIFAFFCHLAVLNLSWYLMLFLATIVVLGIANEFIFRSRFGGYLIASYLGMWLSTPYAVYIFFTR